jgi:hypothetical protein
MPEWLKIPIPIATFVLGFFISRFTLTKEQKAKLEQDYFKNSQELKDKHERIFREYTDAMAAYVKSTDDQTIDVFTSIAVAGDRYFGSINNLAEAVLSKKVDSQIAKGSFIPTICRAANESLPKHFETLREIADKLGIAYSGELDRAEHQASFAVLEKFGETAGEPGSKLAERMN